MKKLGINLGRRAPSTNLLVCDECGRSQAFVMGPDDPGGITKDEAKMIGWSAVIATSKKMGEKKGEKWLCPFHSDKGTAKLDVVLKSMRR